MAKAARVSAAALLALALAGCAGMGLPFEPAASHLMSANGEADTPIPVSDRVDPSDWEMVRQTIAAAPPAAAKGLEWLNPDTGSTGAITALEVATKDGVSCRVFATTINDVRGIRRYRGDACAPEGGRWELRTVTPDDAAIS